MTHPIRYTPLSLVIMWPEHVPVGLMALPCSKFPNMWILRHWCMCSPSHFHQKECEDSYQDHAEHYADPNPSFCTCG